MKLIEAFNWPNRLHTFPAIRIESFAYGIFRADKYTLYSSKMAHGN
jgi:hypothetical protein